MLALLVLVGCGEQNVACIAPTDQDLAAAAARAYIDGRSPKPLRFLSAVSTDSAMPVTGMRVLQDLGPTYLYPPDSAGQEVIHARLAESPWPSMLVTYHGFEHTADAATVRIGGAWVAGELDGQHAGYEEIAFTCLNGSWVTADSAAALSAGDSAPAGG